MSFNLTELKKHLGPGLGLRKNKYMVEIPVPTVNGEVLNVLCQSAGLPERTVNTVEVWHMGRKYNVRGEMDYQGEYELSFIDDDQMKVRKLFDNWMRQVDNTAPDPNSSFLAASFEEINPGLIDNLTDGLRIGNSIKSASQNPQIAQDYVVGLLNDNRASASAVYQTDINVWQLDGRGSADDNKIYGYKLQNAFPKSIGIVTLEDDNENSLSQFSITFAYSEYISLTGNRDIISSIIGEQTLGIVDGTKTLLGI